MYWRQALLIILVAACIHLYVGNLSTVHGDSMLPTLQDGEWLVIDKISYRFHEPRLLDVVIVRNPATYSPEKKLYVKRIVGRAGDLLEIRSGTLYRNGKSVQEKYSDSQIEDEDFGPYQVPPGMYFVMGDNHHEDASLDSREFGAISQANIVGRARWIVWPLVRRNEL